MLHSWGKNPTFKDRWIDGLMDYGGLFLLISLTSSVQSSGGTAKWSGVLVNQPPVVEPLCMRCLRSKLHLWQTWKIWKLEFLLWGKTSRIKGSRLLCTTVGVLWIHKSGTSCHKAECILSEYVVNYADIRPSTEMLSLVWLLLRSFQTSGYSNIGYADMQYIALLSMNLWLVIH